jgi:di/tricarboxylate transporter
MRIMATSVFVLLSLVAALHVYWGFGGLRPATDVRSLIDAVVGDPRMSQMPSTAITLVVAALIFASGVFALAAQARASRIVRLFIKAAIATIALVFVGRGVSGYALPVDIRSRLSEPFATYDQLFYAPLCLVLGAAFVALYFARPIDRKAENSK